MQTQTLNQIPNTKKITLQNGYWQVVTAKFKFLNKHGIHKFKTRINNEPLKSIKNDN